jgi:hypothetical protein
MIVSVSSISPIPDRDQRMGISHPAISTNTASSHAKFAAGALLQFFCQPGYSPQIVCQSPDYGSKSPDFPVLTASFIRSAGPSPGRRGSQTTRGLH